ncbi:MAG: iron ABC transporter permease [Pseudomonadota bacterium]
MTDATRASLAVPGRRGPRKARFNVSAVVLVLAVAVLALVTVVPLVPMTLRAFTNDGSLTLEHVSAFLADPHLMRSAFNTVGYSLAIGVASALLAMPLAFGIARTDMPLKKLLTVSALISVFSPGFLITIAYIDLLGPNNGSINVLLRGLLGLETTFGPLDIYSGLGLVLLTLPGGIALCLFQIVPALGKIDPGLEAASRIAGASAWQTVRRVTLPLVRPAILSGFVLAFTLSVGSYGIPQMLGMNVLSVTIRETLLISFNLALAAVLAAVSIVIGLVAVAGYQYTTRLQSRFEVVAGRGSAGASYTLGPWRYVLAGAGVVYFVLAILLPYAVLIVSSFLEATSRGLTADNLTLEFYTNLVTDPYYRTAIFNSMTLAVGTGATCAVVGILVGYIIARTAMPGRSLLDYMAFLPLALSGTAFGIAVLLTAFSSPLRWMGLSGTLFIIGFAYVGHYIAFGVRGSQVAFSQVSAQLSEAARIAGANRLQTIGHIEVPIVRNAILSIVFLVGALVFPELSMTIILTGSGTQTVSTALLELWRGGGGSIQAAYAMSSLMLVIVLALMVIGNLIRSARTVR